MNYPKIRNLVKYLDNEELMKTNMSVKPPTHKVGEDVERFSEKFVLVKKAFEMSEKLFEDKELLTLLETCKQLKDFEESY